MRLLGKCLTVTAGALVAVACYALLARTPIGDAAADSGIQSWRLFAANLGAVGAAILVGTCPSEKQAPLGEMFATWALATGVLMVMLGPRHAQIAFAAAKYAAVAAGGAFVY
jgi:hypothetical protein